MIPGINMHGSSAESEDYDCIVLTWWPPNMHCALFSKIIHTIQDCKTTILMMMHAMASDSSKSKE